ncbi:MAG TPA: hypothetical protein VHZ28_07260, partial [Terracidiphilus sp.]|nr:hypothetical protein [Terracidiphilus sp.]
MEHGHGFIAWILIGIAVGWFANRAAESRAYGRLTDLISSLVGAMIGGFLTTHFGFGAVSG